jgi:hypothetical protein
MNEHHWAYMFWICLLGAVIGLTFGIALGVSAMEHEAVAHGKAEYVPDAQGAAKWQWKP